jgi:hypothetical protein
VEFVLKRGQQVPELAGGGRGTANQQESQQSRVAGSPASSRLFSFVELNPGWQGHGA